MSSSSSSKSKRPDIDRKLLVRMVKDRMTSLRGATRYHIATKAYGSAESTSCIFATYERLLQDITRGLYDVVLPKDAKNG